MTKKKILAAVVIVLVLIVIGLVVVSMTSHKTNRSTPPLPSATSSATPSPSSSSDAADDSEDPTNGDTPASADATPAAPATSDVVPGTSLRAVHSPTSVANDIQLANGQCKLRTVDANVGKYLPDPNCTPGAIDPAVTQDNIGTTICKSGYTKTVRATDTDKYKAFSLRQYGISANKTTEYDHLISLQLGGTNAVSNLWAEPNKANASGTTNPKDAVETKLKVAVCAHKVTLDKAQKAIATDWTTAEKVLGL